MTDDSFSLPRRSVDPDETLDDRLTDNVKYGAGPARYFLGDEDWTDVFHRVARNVALGELPHLESAPNYLPATAARDSAPDWVVKENGIYTGERAMPYLKTDVVYEYLADDYPDAFDALTGVADEFETLMREQRFMPNSPTLMNAGAQLQQLSACFTASPGDALTISPEDSDREAIMEAAKDAAGIFKSGGGVGYAFHHLRPMGADIRSTEGVSSGPMSFMEVFNTVCGTVEQGGKRRGAQMGIMHVQHPDIGRFLVAKRGEENLTNFNISAGLTDEFLDAVRHGLDFTLYDPEVGFQPTDSPEAFEVVPETAHFYDPQFEDAWNEERDKPGVGLDGKVVQKNFWRDYQDQMQDPEAFDEFRDELSMEPGEPMEIPAEFIWRILVDGAHNNGEPGFVYLDEINREHSFDVVEHPDHFVHSTNPCVTGDTLVYTNDGLVEAETLYEQGTAQDVVVDSRLDDESVKEASSVYQTGEKEVYTLTTEEGHELRLTADHRVMTDDGWVEAQHLDAGDTVHILDREGGFGQHGSAELGRVMGWLVGDSHLKHGEERAVLNFYDEDSELSEYFAADVNEVVREPLQNRDYEVGVSDIKRSDDYRGAQAIEQRVRSTRLYEMAEQAGLVDEKLQVPDEVFGGSREQARGFLSALFTADGGVQGTKEKGHSVRLGTVSLDLAKETQQLLLNFGIKSTIYQDRQGGLQEMPDGQGGTKEYDTQPRHEVCITAANLVRFQERIGFLRSDKQEQLAEVIDSYDRGPYEKPFEATVEAVESDGVEAVYDLTEPDTESFVAGGLVVHNCSEQPLENYEACNLGHVNTSLLVEEDAPTYDGWLDAKMDTIEFESFRHEELVPRYMDEALDLDALGNTVQVGTRFLDNVVTMSRFPEEVPKIAEQVENKRKIGLGLMGFHQLAIQLGIRYGSEASTALASELMRRIDAHSTATSHELSQVRGVFPEWDESKWSSPTEHAEWFEKHAHSIPEAHPDGYEVRNHNMTTIAPTGTTSMIGDTTAGCEPIFSVAFFKNVGDDIQGEDMLVEFDDYFLQVLEHNGIDAEAVKTEAIEQMKNNEFDGIEGLSNVPNELGELFVTTNELTVEQHVDVQAAFQAHVDSAISKTLNLPNEASIEEVGDAIDRALRSGIKGATVYRDGSRQEQVKTTRMDNSLEDDEPESIAEELAEQFDEEELKATMEALEATMSAEDTEAGAETEPALADD